MKNEDDYKKYNFIYYLIFWVAFIGMILFVYYCDKNNPKTIPTYNKDKVMKIIDSLNCKIDSLNIENNRLYEVIDSSKNNIKIIERWHEKEYNTILTQPIDSDCKFFSDYVSSYSK